MLKRGPNAEMYRMMLAATVFFHDISEQEADYDQIDKASDQSKESFQKLNTWLEEHSFYPAA